MTMYHVDSFGGDSAFIINGIANSIGFEARVQDMDGRVWDPSKKRRNLRVPARVTIRFIPRKPIPPEKLREFEKDIKWLRQKLRKWDEERIKVFEKSRGKRLPKEDVWDKKEVRALLSKYGIKTG